jgi:glyoxalase family protein
MENRIPGIHHVTAIAGDPQTNIDFYAGILGLRLVKLTVNFDDPGTYHVYYGDGQGHPGTILTFFPWPGARRGRIGTGQVTVISFAVPETMPGIALDFWERYLRQHNVNCKRDYSLLGEPLLARTRCWISSAASFTCRSRKRHRLRNTRISSGGQNEFRNSP